MAKKTGKKASKDVETLTHDEAKRANIPTAEYQSVMEQATTAVREVQTRPSRLGSRCCLRNQRAGRAKAIVEPLQSLP